MSTLRGTSREIVLVDWPWRRVRLRFVMRDEDEAAISNSLTYTSVARRQHPSLAKWSCRCKGATLKLCESGDNCYRLRQLFCCYRQLCVTMAAQMFSIGMACKQARLTCHICDRLSEPRVDQSSWLPFCAAIFLTLRFLRLPATRLVLACHNVKHCVC
jgi:hypothetical protein